MEEANEVVNTEAVETAAPTESTTEENNESTVDESTDSQEETTTEDEQSTDEEVTDTEQPKKGAEARIDQLQKEIDGYKSQLEDPNRAVRDKVAERNTLRTQVEQTNAQVYQAATVDQLLETVNPETGDYFNRLEAQIEAMNQERKIERYNNQVSDSLFTIESEAQNALKDFPMFDSDSPEFNRDVALEVAELLEASLIRDKRVPEIDPETGQPTGKGAIIGSRISPYKLYKSHAAAAKANAVKAETQAQKNVETMLKNADPTTGGKGLLKSFDQMSLKEQEAHLRKQGHDV